MRTEFLCARINQLKVGVAVESPFGIDERQKDWIVEKCSPKREFVQRDYECEGVDARVTVCVFSVRVEIKDVEPCFQCLTHNIHDARVVAQYPALAFVRIKMDFFEYECNRCSHHCTR